ncbi:MAG: hypothetical protein EOM07_13475 [Clostridia bacterium]|nr:hypothetical protein [Clostridia bacterium]
MAFILSGCSKEEKPMSRAVFAWEGVVESDKQILENHQIDTIFMDINHYSAVPGYNIYLLAGDPSWGLEDMEKVVEEAKEKKADGVIFDIEGNYEALASNLSLLESALPIYICIPFWLEEDVQEEIIQEADGVVVMNYSKGNERANLEEEMAMADQYDKAILTAYELQSVGEYGLEEHNTYNEDGLDAVEKNYEEQFGGTDVGIAFHNLNMMRELNPAGIEGK